MTEDDALSPEERQAFITRYGEYRRVRIAQYGQFRLDMEWSRHLSHGEIELLPHLVFEIDASSEFDMLGTTTSLYKMRGRPTAEWTLPSRAQIIQLVTKWLNTFRPLPGGGITSVACYRRRVGLGADGHEATPGEWYIPVLFRRPSGPLIDMEEAAPLVEAALRELEQAETNDHEPGHGQG